MKDFFKFILMQDIEWDEDKKAYEIFHAVLFIVISLALSYGMYYLLKDYIKDSFLLKVVWIYFTLCFLSNQPAAAIAQKKDITDIKPWIFQFGFYNSLGVFAAPIYLGKYCFDKKRKS